MTDWNGNGREDAGDWYIDYEIMNNNGGNGEASDGNGCGCLLLIFAVIVFISLF